MKLFNKVAVVGVGLIGGSMALAIKKKGIAGEVIGVSRHKKTLWLAKKIGAIDKGGQNLQIIKDADLVILATPVSTILRLAPIISKIINPDCIVTDVGSTKQEIVSTLERLFPRYIGSHPLAGSEKRSIAHACPDIFKGSLCILTPTRNSERGALKKMEMFWKILGARVVFLNTFQHDKILSFVSHLPHALAFSLIDIMPKKYLPFAANGLKDTTRIAASDSELWADIFLSNQKNMLKAIGLLQDNLDGIKAAIRKKDKRLLSSILKQAKNKREILG